MWWNVDSFKPIKTYANSQPRFYQPLTQCHRSSVAAPPRASVVRRDGLGRPKRPGSAPALLRGDGLIVERPHQDAFLQRLEDSEVQWSINQMRKEALTSRKLAGTISEDALVDSRPARGQSGSKRPTTPERGHGEVVAEVAGKEPRRPVLRAARQRRLSPKARATMSPKSPAAASRRTRSSGSTQRGSMKHPRQSTVQTATIGGASVSAPHQWESLSHTERLRELTRVLHGQEEDPRVDTSRKSVGARLMAELDAAKLLNGSPFTTLRSRFERVRQSDAAAAAALSPTGSGVAEEDGSHAQVASLPPLLDDPGRRSVAAAAASTAKQLRWKLPDDESGSEPGQE